MRYTCPICNDYESKYLVPFKKHTATCGEEDEPQPTTHKDADTEKMLLQVKMLELQLKLKEIETPTPNIKLNKLTPKTLTDLSTTNLLGIRNIVNNQHRRTVITRGLVDAVVMVLKDIIRKISRPSFPIVCLSLNKPKVYFHIEGKWVAEQDTHFSIKKLIIVICQHLMLINDEDRMELGLRKSEDYILFINRLSAWDLHNSENHCEKILYKSIYEVLHYDSNNYDSE